MQGFDNFWTAWPKSPRKGGKSACLKIWVKNYNETQADLIIAHVQYMKRTEDWAKNNGAFIPMPSTYLNQQRWDGAEVPEMVSKSEIDPELLKIAQDTKKAAPPPSDFFNNLRKNLHN